MRPAVLGRQVDADLLHRLPRDHREVHQRRQHDLLVQRHAEVIGLPVVRLLGEQGTHASMEEAESDGGGMSRSARFEGVRASRAHDVDEHLAGLGNPPREVLGREVRRSRQRLGAVYCRVAHWQGREDEGGSHLQPAVVEDGLSALDQLMVVRPFRQRWRLPPGLSQRPRAPVPLLLDPREIGDHFADEGSQIGHRRVCRPPRVDRVRRPLDRRPTDTPRVARPSRQSRWSPSFPTLSPSRLPSCALRGRPVEAGNAS